MILWRCCASDEVYRTSSDKQSNLFSLAFKFLLVGENYKMEVSSESPQNNPEGTELPQGDEIWCVSFIFFFITNFCDVPKVVFIPTQSL